MLLLNDFSTTVRKAFSEIDPKWEEYSGLVVCGTHSPHSIDEMLGEIKKAREEKTPFLGICFGMQLMAIEYARNVLGISNATSEEFGKGIFVVKKMPQMRVGIFPAIVNGKIQAESFWHNYQVVPNLFWDGFEIVEIDDVVTSMRLKGINNFQGVQFHPEYGSLIKNPHPILLSFINKCKKHEI